MMALHSSLLLGARSRAEVHDERRGIVVVIQDRSCSLGLWIDHRQAVIVSVAGHAETIQRVSSNVEGHHRQSGSTPADDARQRELTEHLNRYYEEVVSHIRDAESILIFGPGEEKGELKARLEKDRPAATWWVSKHPTR